MPSRSRRKQRLSACVRLADTAPDTQVIEMLQHMKRNVHRLDSLDLDWHPASAPHAAAASGSSSAHPPALLPVPDRTASEDITLLSPWIAACPEPDGGAASSGGLGGGGAPPHHFGLSPSLTTLLGALAPQCNAASLPRPPAQAAAAAARGHVPPANSGATSLSGALSLGAFAAPLQQQQQVVGDAVATVTAVVGGTAAAPAPDACKTRLQGAGSVGAAVAAPGASRARSPTSRSEGHLAVPMPSGGGREQGQGPRGMAGGQALGEPRGSWALSSPTSPPTSAIAITATGTTLAASAPRDGGSSLGGSLRSSGNGAAAQPQQQQLGTSASVPRSGSGASSAHASSSSNLLHSPPPADQQQQQGRSGSGGAAAAARPRPARCSSPGSLSSCASLPKEADVMAAVAALHLSRQQHHHHQAQQAPMLLLPPRPLAAPAAAATAASSSTSLLQQERARRASQGLSSSPPASVAAAHALPLLQQTAAPGAAPRALYTSSSAAAALPALPPALLVPLLRTSQPLPSPPPSPLAGDGGVASPLVPQPSMLTLAVQAGQQQGGGGGSAAASTPAAGSPSFAAPPSACASPALLLAPQPQPQEGVSSPPAWLPTGGPEAHVARRALSHSQLVMGRHGAALGGGAASPPAGLMGAAPLVQPVGRARAAAASPLATPPVSPSQQQQQLPLQQQQQQQQRRTM